MVFGSVDEVVLAEHEIAIALYHSELGGGHLGVVFNEKGNKRKVLELGWHHRLFLSDLPKLKCGIAVPLALPPAASKGVVAIVRAVSRKLPKISYGIDFLASKGSFSGSVYSARRGSHGLTCAWFVLELLRAAAVPLIREETWEHSAENFKWAEEVIAILREKGADEKHVAAVEKGVNGLRLVPFELAAAATFPTTGRPASYSEVQPMATELRMQLSAACSPSGAIPVSGAMFLAG